MKKLTTLLLILTAMVISQNVLAQKGILRGSIIDDETGEPLIGASIGIAELGIGSGTDLDGKFSINNIAPGTYTVQASYVSYTSQVIEGVEIKDGEVTIINVRLKGETLGLQEIVVSAQAIRNNENALLTVQKKSSLVLDAIASDQFSRLGDADAAAAMQRVTGVSVQGGKYVFVRGLGDRYSKTTLNTAEIPGLDPNKNTVQMDLFPTNLIDNIVVYKTFSPELPASFTGGLVNVNTKEFPETFTLQASFSGGYNTNASFNDKYLTHDLGKGHVGGFKDERRILPNDLKDGVPAFGSVFNDPALAAELDRDTRSIRTPMGPETSQMPMNHSASFSLGNQVTFLGKDLGFIGGVTYSRSYEYYENGSTGRFLLPGTVAEESLAPLYLFNDRMGKDNVLWGALFNTTLKINDRNKIGLNVMRNQSAEGSTRFQEGLFPFNAGGEDDSRIIQARSLQYVERVLNSAQLKGSHSFGSTGAVNMDWISSATLSSQEEPDLRFFNNLAEILMEGDTAYDALSNNVKRPSRFFRSMEERNFDNKLNFEIPIVMGGRKGSKIKFGASYTYKERDFDERVFEYINGPSTTFYNNNIDDYFSDSNIGKLGDANFDFGLYLREQPSTGTYSASEAIPAAYIMGDLMITEKLRASFGTRFEQTDINLEMGDASLADSIRLASLQRNDLLPAVNITYNSSENSNFRFAYGRTLARPTFRELARFATFDFLGDFLLLGNPNLERTTIDNIDFRWETFPSSGEIISISAFYKNFQNPIERAINPLTNDLALEFNFRNVPTARVMGVEFEIRKSLEALSPSLKDFKLGTNVTLINSRVDISEGELSLIRLNDPEAKSYRPLFGQAPYIINAYINYENPFSGWSSNVSFNVSGERMTVVSVGGTPNVFEQPRAMLDMNVKKNLGSRWSAKFSATNLLNAEYKFTQSFNDKAYIYQNSQIGSTFSLGFAYLIE
ncbi:TonB-dependent receptor domain-containing protein [Peijinzhouia sedimentorum]